MIFAVSFSLDVLPAREDEWDRDAIVTWILGLPGFRVERIDGEEAEATSRLRIRIERRGNIAGSSCCRR